jgi:hypothetical protein
VMLASPNFTIFMECYVLNFGTVIFERLYLNPFIEVVEQKLQTCIVHLAAHNWLFKKLFEKVVIGQLLEQKKLQSATNKDISEVDMTDRMFGTLVQFSAQSQATFMMPLVYLFISNFADATQIPKNYAIRQSDVNYYMMFSLTIIAPQIILDVFMLHLIECLYEYKLFDYLTYCSHRFATRQNWWRYVLGLKLDKSLLPTWRSIDGMCFSSQYYFAVALASWGTVCLTLSFTIMIRNSFHPCGDPLILCFLLIVRYGGVMLKNVFLALRPIIRLWVPKPHPIFVEEEIENDSEDQIVPLVEDYAIENELKHKLETDVFKSKFVKKNIPFIIEHLEDIVGNNQQCHNYLKERYSRLVNKHVEDEKDRNYVEQRLELLKLLPNNKFNAEFEVSFDREEETRPKAKKLGVIAEKIARQWVSKAKLFLLLKKTVEDEEVLEEKCKVCNMSDHLKVVTSYRLDDIYTMYQETYKGYPLKLTHWKVFYFRKQKIRTLCVDCAYLEQLKLKNDPRAFSSLTKVAYEEFRLAQRNHGLITETTAKIAKRWLELARARLGDHENDYGELYTIESVSEQDLSAVISQLEEPQDDYSFE